MSGCARRWGWRVRVGFGLALGIWAALSQAQLLRPAPERGLAPKAAAAAAPGGIATVQVTGGPTQAVITWTLNPQTLQVPAGTPRATLATAPLIAGGNTKAAASTPAAAVIERLMPGVAPVRIAPSADGSAKAIDAGPLRPGVALTYRVTVTDAKGAPSQQETTWTPPRPRDPQGLTATVAADGRVTLSWQPVTEAAGYQISSTALPAPVRVSHTTQWTSPAAMRPGKQQWKVASVYEPGGALTAATAWPAVVSHTLPTASRPYLVMPNGPGDPAQSAASYEMLCSGQPPPGSPTTDCAKAAMLLAQSPAWTRSWNSQYGGGRIEPDWPIAAFADLNDLGLGRRVNCTLLQPPPRSAVLCWATSHGALPGPQGRPDGSQLAAAAEGMADVKSLNVILMTAQGAFFGTWEAKPWTPRGQGAFEREGHYADDARHQLGTALDSQGPKQVPHACLSCHGGRYDATRKLVVGASLLPLVPAHLSFSSPQARAAAEEPIRRINRLILDAYPSPTVREQIGALYGGAIDTPGARANDAAVPPGWVSQPGLYRQVVAPYCGGCHFAQTGALTFASFANLQQQAQRVQRAVCRDFTMPHSEQGLRRIWSEGGAVSLPGLLSTALGFAKCPE